MTLLDTLKKDQLNARRGRNSVIANLLGTVISECERLAKSEKVARTLTDNEVMAVIKRTQKNLTETIKLVADKPERATDLAKLQTESSHLDTYMPKQLTDDEITDIAIRLHSMGLDLGKIMTHLKENYTNRYDPKIASGIIREIG